MRDLLQEGHRLLPERSLEIIDGVLRALDYSHRNGIVHRDIKPANVMVTRSGEIKVMDFGIARAMSDAQATMTQTAQVIGTAQYLSPEQARGERVDARSDLYSTGCLMYELLVGRPPFTGDSPVAIAYQHVRENPVPPSRLDPNLPPWADAIVLRAMAKSPNERYQTAAEMQADVQRAQSGMQVAAMAPPPTRMDYYGGGYQDATQRMGSQTMMAPGTQQIPPYQQGGGYDDYGGGYDDRKGGGRRWVPWVIAAIVLIAAGVVAAMLLSSNNGGKGSAFVPIVQGDSQSQAVAALKAVGFNPVVVDQNSSTVATGKVINTSPAGGSSATKGQNVTVYLSEGVAQVKVPTIYQGESESAAESALTKVGLTPDPVPDPTSTQPANTVDHISPAAGKLVSPGSQVTLYVSGGGQTPQNVLTQSASTAVEILKAQGFTDISTVYAAAPTSEMVQPGYVWKQVPGSNAPVPLGTKITIFVQPQNATPSPSATPSASASPSATPSNSASPNPSATNPSPNPSLPFSQ